MKLTFTIIILTLLTFQLRAQQPQSIGKTSPFYAGYIAKVDPSKSYMWKFERTFTSVSFTLMPPQKFSKAHLITESDTFILSHDSHTQQDTLLVSNLIVFNRPMNSFEFHSGELSGAIKIHLHSVETLNASKKKDQKRLNERQEQDNCITPIAIPPSTWRAGLNSPVLLPEATEVRHLIIHHSAGSNNNTNYVEVVRNIYVFHTSPVSMGGRGYNDIGYNYLIAADGTIFQGRDEQGVMEKDDVLGAHMCAKNRNTMGICLLGTFTNIKPTQAAFNSLYDVLTWKAHKDNIDPLGYLEHPLTNPDRPLQNIAGHRQGCGPNDTSATNQVYTECPGDSVAYFLPAIRAEVKRRLTLCSPNSIEEKHLASNAIKIYPKPAEDYFTVEVTALPATIRIIDVHGIIHQTIIAERLSTMILTEKLRPGIYSIEVKEGLAESKFTLQAVVGK